MLTPPVPSLYTHTYAPLTTVHMHTLQPLTCNTLVEMRVEEIHQETG